MTSNGDVDSHMLRSHVDYLVTSGVDGLFVGGTTAEFPLLTLDERRFIVEVAIHANRGRVPVVAHTGALRTEDAIDLSRHADASGADAIALMPPWYYALSDPELSEHFQSVARSVPDLPVLLYDIPSRTGNALSPGLIADLAHRMDNLVGIKDSTGSLEHQRAVQAATAPGFVVFSGSDELAHAALEQGATGLVSGTANLAPRLIVDLYDAHRTNQPQLAAACQRQLTELVGALGDGSIAALKGTLNRCGRSVGTVRLPLMMPPSSSLQAAAAVMTAARVDSRTNGGPMGTVTASEGDIGRLEEQGS